MYRVFQKELYKRALKTKVKLGVFCYILTVQNVVYVFTFVYTIFRCVSIRLLMCGFFPSEHNFLFYGALLLRL
jgi:hypothetical protein